MDVSRSEAQRAETNVIARSDDRAATTEQRRPRDDFATTPFDIRPRAVRLMSADRPPNGWRMPHGRCINGIYTAFKRRFRCAVDVARSTLGLRRSVFARSTLRAITFTPKLRCAPFFRSHPSPLLTPLSRRLQCLFRRESESFQRRTGVLSAKDWSPSRRGLENRQQENPGL
jgi:hypothetical protein